MYEFGKSSKEKLETCHEDIQLILNELIKFYDFSILEGTRSTERQQELFNSNKSKIDGIKVKSKHQSFPSNAVDIMPYKKGTNAFEDNVKERDRFYMMMGMVKAISKKLLEEGKISHEIRFGLDWDGDDTFRDQTFDDLPHFELV